VNVSERFGRDIMWIFTNRLTSPEYLPQGFCAVFRSMNN
jgi:hypothetical protein